MEINATRMRALLVSMADVVVLAVDDQRREAICVHVEQRVERPVCVGVEVARELGCDWHTVNDAVIAYGTPLVEDPARVGAVTAVRARRGALRSFDPGRLISPGPGDPGRSPTV